VTAPLPPPAPAPAVVPPPTIYPSEHHWYADWFSKVFTRPLSVNWCRKWQEHLEVVVVLRELWKTWDMAQVSVNPDSMAVWLRDYAYPFLDRLMIDRGTVHGCDWRMNTHSMDTREPLG
jgi:hypothetical protein